MSGLSFPSREKIDSRSASNIKVRVKDEEDNTARRNMLLLFETPAGYSLFKVKDENKLKDIDVRSSSRCLLFSPFFFCVRRQLEGN